MPKTTTGSTSIRLHGSTPGHIVKISEAGHLESMDMEEHGDFTALTLRVDATETELDTKQDIIADDDLTIARTSGLQTALDSKQSTISSSSFLTVAKLTFPSATSGNGNIQSNDTMSFLNNLELKNCKLVGNDILTTGSTAYIQNGNLINFSGLNAATLDCTGVSTAKEHVNTQVSNIVRGYGMFWFTHTHTDYDMNTFAGKSIRWTAKHVDTSLFLLGNPNIQVLVAGFYEVSFTVFCTSGTQRPNPTIALFKNGTEFTSIAAHSYIRSADNHNNSTWTASPGIVQMAANDTFVVKGFYTGSGRQGNVYLMNGGGTSFTNVLGSVPIRPYMLIKRISD